MLAGTKERAIMPKEGASTPKAERSRWAKALRIEWIGQTVASGCWIASVFTYGISSGGDWLQLFAASSWFLANIASIADSDT